MAIEGEQTLSQVTDNLHFLLKNAVQTSSVNFDVTARFVHLIKQSHLVLNNANDFVDVTSVRMNQLLFLLKNLLDQLFVVRAQVIHIHAILAFKLSLSFHLRVQCVHLYCLNRNWTLV